MSSPSPTKKEEGWEDPYLGQHKESSDGTWAVGLLCSSRLSSPGNGGVTVGPTQFWLHDVQVVHNMLLAVHLHSFPAYEGETWLLSSAFDWERDQMTKRTANLPPAVVLGHLDRIFF